MDIHMNGVHGMALTSWTGLRVALCGGGVQDLSMLSG